MNSHLIIFILCENYFEYHNENSANVLYIVLIRKMMLQLAYRIEKNLQK